MQYNFNLLFNIIKKIKILILNALDIILDKFELKNTFIKNIRIFIIIF